MVTITKEDAEFLAGFIDQWLPVCGEKTAERARAVKECLTVDPESGSVNIDFRRGNYFEAKISGGSPVVGCVPGIDNAISVGYMADGMGANVIVTGPPEPLYDGKALIDAIDGAIANGARINVPEYDLSDLAVSPITDDEDPEYAENYWQDGDDE